MNLIETDRLARRYWSTEAVHDLTLAVPAGRVFALLGYEIVEGSVDDGRIRETRRINYSPRSGVAMRSSDEEE